MIYICIPTHNEQQTVGVVLWKLRQVLTEFHRDYQLLVADDASTDKTPEVLEPYTRVLPLTVIRSETRLGHAAALEMLLREAVRRSEYPKRDFIVTLQADFSEEPDDVVPMIKRLEAGADLVLGNKVSVTRPTRVLRFARALGSFFTRSQQWPEGVTTPFDGYRAYRLYGVKRALEESAGRRLIRYDGWAGNAELLRAVSPHARRVEVLDVEDRSDRLQRPRRERPLASAMRVRPMVRGIEPPGLVSVEALERVAATASRSRDAARASDRSEPQRTGTYDRVNGRARQQRGPGARPRNGRERRPDRPQSADRPAPTRAEASRKPAADRPRTGRPDAGGQSRPDTPRQRGQGSRPAAPADAGAAAGDAPPSVTPPVAQAATPEASANGVAPEQARPKKRRRRRKRGAGGAAAGTASPQNGAPNDAANPPESADVAELGHPDDQADEESDVLSSERSGTVEGSTDAREPKRRRRRGGRGRRRGARAASADAAPAGEPAPASEAPGLPGDERAALPVVPPEPTAAPAPPTVSEEQ